MCVCRLCVSKLSPIELTIGYVRDEVRATDDENDDDEWVAEGEESFDPLKDFDDGED